MTFLDQIGFSWFATLIGVVPMALAAIALFAAHRNGRRLDAAREAILRQQAVHEVRFDKRVDHAQTIAHLEMVRSSPTPPFKMAATHTPVARAS